MRYFVAYSVKYSTSSTESIEPYQCEFRPGQAWIFSTQQICIWWCVSDHIDIIKMKARRMCLVDNEDKTKFLLSSNIQRIRDFAHDSPSSRATLGWIGNEKWSPLSAIKDQTLQRIYVYIETMKSSEEIFFEKCITENEWSSAIRRIIFELHCVIMNLLAFSC